MLIRSDIVVNLSRKKPVGGIQEKKKTSSQKNDGRNCRYVLSDCSSNVESLVSSLQELQILELR